MRPVEMRPKGPRAEVGFLGEGQRAPSQSARGFGAVSYFSGVRGRALENLDFRAFWELRNRNHIE